MCCYKTCPRQIEHNIPNHGGGGESPCWNRSPPPLAALLAPQARCVPSSGSCGPAASAVRCPALVACGSRGGDQAARAGGSGTACHFWRWARLRQVLGRWHHTPSHSSEPGNCGTVRKLLGTDHGGGDPCSTPHFLGFD